MKVYLQCIILSLVALFLNGEGWSKDAKTILEQMTKARKYNTAQMNATMEIIDRDGDKTTMKLKMFEQKEGDKSLMRFTHPARLKGTSILSVGDNIWYYNKRSNRVRLLSSSAKKGSMMGSSFSYDDMSSNYEKDFTSEIIKETDKEYVLKLTPRDSDKKFKYIEAYVTKSNFVANKLFYFDKSDSKYKELIAKNVIKKGEQWVPLHMKMTDLNTQKATIFSIDEGSIKYNVSIKRGLFSERQLKR